MAPFPNLNHPRLFSSTTLSPRLLSPGCFRLLALAPSSLRNSAVPSPQRKWATPPPRATAPEPEKRVFVLPLDYYSVLKARRINSAEILRRNYENAVRSPPGVGYSEASLRSRAMILKLAADCLLESEHRRKYDASIAHGSSPGIEVRLADIPGALVILQESGEMNKVLEYGTKWLNSNDDHPASRDVALTMALAYCDLASDTLARNEGGIAHCCDELETAINLLSHFKVSPELQEDIKGTLRELRPQYILEQFALPDDGTNAGKKAKAMKQLKTLVWEVDDDLNLSPFLEDRQAYLQQARANLTAMQQIELYEHAPKDVTIPIMEIYDTALAYVAAGYREKWPQHIYQASSQLQKIQVASMAGLDPDAMDVSVELGLCALLLGESAKALNFLGLARNANKLPNEEVLAYVKENSPSADDLLPGVCALAERWLKDTIIPNYKEMSISQTSLGEWFQSKKVSMYLQVLERGKELNLLSAASATMKLSSSVAKGITTAVSKSFSGIKGIIKRPTPQTEEEPIFKGKLGGETLPDVPMPSAPIEDMIEMDDMEELRRLNSLNGTGSTSHNGSAPPTSGRDKGVHSELSKVMGGDMAIGSSWNDDGGEQGFDHAEMIKNSLDAVPTTPISTNGNHAPGWELNGSEPHYMSDEVPPEPKTTRSSSGFFGTALFKAIVAGGVVLAVAALGIKANQRSFSSPHSNITPLQRMTDRISDIFVDYQGALDVPLAEELLSRWHDVKAEALGATHNTELLADVLEGNMLKQWKDRAHYVKKDGWHWKYKILDLSVDKVSVSRDGRKATVEARIKERAELIDQGRKADWYSTSYSVQYELSMHKKGWKISSSRVVYESK